MRVLLLDPSRFTAPYDAALSDGLTSVGVSQTWVVRWLRPGETEVFAQSIQTMDLYGPFDQAATIPVPLRAPAKALAHLFGLARIVQLAWSRAFDLVHFQWAVVPLADALAIWMIRFRVPVVVTVHDTVPFNGERVSWLQNAGFDAPLRAANLLIVHTDSAYQTLISRGFPPERIVIVPHGPLSAKSLVCASAHVQRDQRFTFVMFGQIKPYKGLDILVDAIARTRTTLEGRARLVVAGAAHMDLAPVQAAIAAGGLQDLIELRIGRLTEEEVAALLEEADAFVLPYRQIDASGVFHLIRPLEKWIIASRVGVFLEELENGESGSLVEPGNIDALAEALVWTCNARPRPTAPPEPIDWIEIGRRTVSVYEAIAGDGRKTANADGPLVNETAP